MRGPGRSDLHVRLRVVVPEKVNDKVRALLEGLANELAVDGGKLGKRRKGFFG